MNSRPQHIVGAIAALIAAYCVHWLDMSFAGKVAPAIADSFGQPLQAMTYVFSGGRLGMAVGAVAGGFAGDRWGRKPVLCVCLSLAAILALVTPAARVFWLFVTLRTLSGLMLGAAAPCALALVAGIAPARWRPLAITATLAGASTGSALGSLMVYLLPGPADWLLGIALCGVASVAAVLMVIGWVPHVHVPVATSRASVNQLWGPMRPTSLVLGIGFALTLGLSAIMVSWQPSYFNKLADIPLQQFAGYISITAPCGIAGMLTTGWLVSHVARGKLLFICFGGHALALICVGNLSAGSMEFVIALAAAAWGHTACQALLNLTLVARYPDAIRATALGGAAAVGRISGVLSPAIGAAALSMAIALPQLFALFALVPLCVGTLLWVLELRVSPAWRPRL